jgi:hypothetical protein
MLQRVDGAPRAAAFKEPVMTPSKPNTSSISSPTVAPAGAPSPTPEAIAALAADVQQIVASIDTTEAGLGADPSLAPKDRRRAAKLRKGGDAIVAQLGALALQNQLESPALQVASMQALLAKADALKPLDNRLAAFARHVSDVIFASQSQAWGMAMQYYALLQRRSLIDAELAKALAPITQFLSYRHPSTKAPKGSPTKRQVAAAKKAQKALATVAAGSLATADLVQPRKRPALPARAPASAPAALTTKE